MICFHCFGVFPFFISTKMAVIYALELVDDVSPVHAGAKGQH